MEKTIKKIKRILPIIGIILFIYILLNTGISNIVSALSEVNLPLLIIAVILLIVIIIGRNVQWQIILRRQKIKIGFLKSLKIQLIGRFYSSTTPGNIGYYLKIFYLKEQTNEPLGKLFVNSFITGTVTSISLYIMMVIGAIVLSEQYPPAFYASLIFLLINGILCLYFVKKERGERTIKTLIRYFIPQKLKNHLNSFTDTFYKDFPKIRYLIIPFIVGGILNLVSFSQTYIIALSLGINQIAFLPFMAIMTIVYLVTVIPITVGGLGTREATMVSLFSLYGVEPASTVALSLTNFLINNIPNTYGLMLAISETTEKREISRVRKHVNKAIKGLTSVGSKFL